MKRTAIVLNVLVVLAMVFAATTSAYAQAPTPGTRPVPASVDALKTDVVTADYTARKISTSLVGKTGPVDVTVRLSVPTAADLIIQAGDTTVVTDVAQRKQLFLVKQQQDKFVGDALKIDSKAKLLGNTTRLMNSVMMTYDAAKLADLAKNPAVVKINPVVNFSYEMWNVVPYIGAADVQASGVTGKGVRVAVLDTGIDYTHKALGGGGDVNVYNSIDPTVVNPAYFPTAKVIGGTDFVGEVWPNGPLQPDPNPIDHVYGAGYPHGTHVSSTLAGVKVVTPDGHTFVGVAPDALLYAIKVCSSVSSSCSGVAMNEGLDFAADPNGDGKLQDRVDVVNMSIGSSFGQAYEDDTSYLSNQLTLLGTLVVASAGNSGNVPYVTGTPAAALGP